jgi:hypothetical protein
MLKQYNKLYFFLSLLFLNTNTYSQIIDSLSVLEGNLITYQHTLNEAYIIEYEENSKYNYIYFMPGLGYDFINSTPYVTYNFSSIASFIKNKKTSKLKINSIKTSGEIKLKNLIIKLRSNYKYCNNLFNRLFEEIEIYKMYYKLFEIESKKYENNEITIEEYLLKQINIKEKKKALNSLKDRIILKIIELETLCNYSIKYNIPKY